MPITELLTRNAKLYGAEVSLIERDPAVGSRRTITWRQFEDDANRFANILLAKGIKKGDKVAILMTNCLEWLPIYFGVLKTGALATPFNFRYTAEEIRDCLNICDARILIFGPEFVERVTKVKNQIAKVEEFIFVGEGTPDFCQSYSQLMAKASAAPVDKKLTDDDNAALYFTSGTTGFPKAILHTHAALMSACVTEQKHHGQTREDNFLCIPPLYHTGAKMHWFGSLISASKAVLLRGVKPQWIFEAISEEKITVVWLLVPWAQDILDAIECGDVNLKDYQLSQWRLMHIGAQPVPPSLILRWREVFPHHLYDTNYGLSESTGPGCVHLGVENIHKVGAIGKPGYNWQALITDQDGKPVPQGSVGELLIKGPGVMKCYYKDEQATAAAIKDGWLYTGDMAQMDEDGFIYLVDRKKDLVICGGENIFPVQIEDFLHNHPAIKDVAVIGLPDQRLGEIVTAIIELKNNADCSETEIKEFCSQLPRYKRPRQIIFADVPRNATGKIEKPRLRQQYCRVQVASF